MLRQVKALKDWRPGDYVPCWAVLRRLVYLRDRRVCWVCGRKIPREKYECGHLVERCIGGPDTPDNLVAMCGTCNWVFKPTHHSRAEAEAWRDEIRTEAGFRAITQWSLTEDIAAAILDLWRSEIAATAI